MPRLPPAALAEVAFDAAATLRLRSDSVAAADIPSPFRRLVAGEPRIRRFPYTAHSKTVSPILRTDLAADSARWTQAGSSARSHAGKARFRKASASRTTRVPPSALLHSRSAVSVAAESAATDAVMPQAVRARRDVRRLRLCSRSRARGRRRFRFRWSLAYQSASPSCAASRSPPALIAGASLLSAPRILQPRSRCLRAACARA